jgi:hypothetical protein
MNRGLIIAMCCTACSGGVGSKNVEIDDTENVSSQPNFASVSQAGVSGALSQQGIDPTFIQSASLVSFSLTCLTAGKDLSFFKSSTLSIETSSSDEVQIASASSFPAGQAEVNYTVVSGVELKPYLTASTYELIPQFVYAGPPPFMPVQVQAAMVIHVNFKL